MFFNTDTSLFRVAALHARVAAAGRAAAEAIVDCVYSGKVALTPASVCAVIRTAHALQVAGVAMLTTQSTFCTVAPSPHHHSGSRCPGPRCSKAVHDTMVLHLLYVLQYRHIFIGKKLNVTHVAV